MNVREDGSRFSTAALRAAVRPGHESLRPVEELKRVDGLRALADLEVELRRPHLPRLTRFGNHLATLDGVPALHQQLTRMGIGGDVAVGVPDQDEIAVALELVA